jgi:CPA2 family monovalent cation:H+ antiporter-2
MHEIDFIKDLAVIMLTAGLVTVVFHHLKQPVVLGYILAGFIIGPYTTAFTFISNEDTIKTLGELGVVFLMFSLGLEFSLRKLARVGATAFIAAISQIALLIWIGYEIGRFFSWGTMDSIFLGAMMAISSTTITVKALEELGLKKEKFANLIYGILIVEDILAISLIVMLNGIATTGHLEAREAFMTFGQLILFMTISLAVGILLIPKLLNLVAKFNSKEMLLTTVLGLLFGFCLLVIKMKYSVALGAFLIGAIMAESRHIHTIEKLIEPVRDMFIAIFFVTIGLLIDPKILFQYAWPITIISIAVITGKVISCSMGTFVTGHDGRTSLRVAMGKAQIGEFSFIIASLGLTLGVTSDFLYPIVVAVSILTTLFTPYLIKGSDPLTDWLDQRIPSAIKNVLVQYSGWISQIRSDNRLREDIRPFVRRITLHVFINTSVVIALFLSAAKVFDLINAYIDMREWTWLHDNYQQAFMWAISLLLSAPFMFAIYRKLEALGLLLADVRISTGNYSEIDRAAIHQLFAQLMPVFAIVALLMLVSALSSSILPPAGMLIVVGFLMASLIYFLRKQLVKIHAKLQIALTESFKDNSGNQPH